tara:strand:+ start:72 stop:764 length:693 start_codon:yes stop_codon:yes gene_type:complete
MANFDKYVLSYSDDLKNDIGSFGPSTFVDYYEDSQYQQPEYEIMNEWFYKKEDKIINNLMKRCKKTNNMAFKWLTNYNITDDYTRNQFYNHFTPKLDKATRQSLQRAFNYIPINPYVWNSGDNLKRLYTIHVNTQSILKAIPEHPVAHCDVFDIDIAMTPELNNEYSSFLTSVNILLSFRLKRSYYKYLHIRELMTNFCKYYEHIRVKKKAEWGFKLDYITMPEDLLRCV